MSGNRVEELESRVTELEATLNGLTEELVETKDRLRELESDESEEYIEAGVGTTPETEVDTEESAVEAAVEGDKHTEDDSTDTTEADDIIVA
ncbi:DUF7518 family protein [Halococcus saccharolyticus]|uniref:Smc operon protein n=1 Tax=Halococcus saccharolyticus DSM 5350 TaxID=1227455 RepID=M0MM51_9EURY|nr:hypothetical protein [Halococcus saccharolyticus]EMA46751.1 hypothetical protein C449_03756 [Halococcus saccharolyticus DSM 5350]